MSTYPDLDGDGFYEPGTPCCDLCGRAQGDSPWSLPLDQPADWNSETGNHLSCEERRQARETGVSFEWTVMDR